jgi:hypothetical protein
VYACVGLSPWCIGRAARVGNSAAPPRQWNHLALVSFLMSLVVPTGFVLAQLAGGIFQPVYSDTPAAYHVGVTLLIAGVPATLVAIFTGHAALDGARRRAYGWPLRWMAIVGLALGYGAVVGYLSGIALFYWLVTHTRWHIPG